MPPYPVYGPAMRAGGTIPKPYGCCWAYPGCIMLGGACPAETLMVALLTPMPMPMPGGMPISPPLCIAWDWPVADPVRSLRSPLEAGAAPPPRSPLFFLRPLRGPSLSDPAEPTCRPAIGGCGARLPVEGSS
eukprot:scaffold218614_cov35-Tisochrysis_lutea.AAC.4